MAPGGPWSDGVVIGTLVEFGLLAIVFIIVEGHMGSRAILRQQLLEERCIGRRGPLLSSPLAATLS